MIDPGVVVEYLPSLFLGLLVTILFTVGSLALGLLIGVIAAVCSLSRLRALHSDWRLIIAGRETELSVPALELALPVTEIETPYYARPEGSFSKLNTWRDGFRILGTILRLYRSEKPLRFFIRNFKT